MFEAKPSHMNFHIIPTSLFHKNFLGAIEKFGLQENNTIYIRRTKKTKQEELRELFSSYYSNEAILAKTLHLTERDHLYIHFLDLEMAKWISKNDFACAIHWVFWGGEFFKVLNNLSSEFSLYDTKNQVYFDKSKSLFFDGKLNLKSILAEKQLSTLVKYFKQASLKIKNLLHFNPYDFELVSSALNPLMEFRHFNYANITNNLGFLNQVFESSKPVTDNNILIGNSASVPNNHLDLIDILRPIQKAQFSFPLAYGDNTYREEVMRSLKEANILHDAMTSTIPLKDYMYYLNSCAATIQWHNRTQAMGNLKIMLYLGKKVILKDNNPAYRYFKSLNYQVFSQEHISSEQIHEPLSDYDIKQNRAILENLMNDEQIKKQYEELFS